MLDLILLRGIFIPSILDFLVVLFLGFALFRGYTQGIIVQTISLFTLLAGIYISAIFANSFYETVVDKSNVYLSNLPIIVFAVLFGIVVFFADWTGLYIKKMVSSIQNNMYSRVWGALFSVTKYLFIVSVVFMLIQRLDEKHHLLDKESSTQLFGPIAALAPAVMPQLEFKSRQTAPVELDDITNEPGYIEELDNLEE